jgi:glycosyltransferase involved in cell wall biosynthesis
VHPGWQRIREDGDYMSERFDVVVPTLMRRSLRDCVQGIYRVIPNANIILATETGIPLGTVRNLGLRRARSEFVAFIDDDVLVNKAWFNKCMTILQDHAELIGVEGSVPEGQTLGCMILRRERFIKAGGYPKLDAYADNVYRDQLFIFSSPTCYHYSKGLTLIRHALHWIFSFYQTESPIGVYHNPKTSLKMIIKFLRAKKPEMIVNEIIYLIKTIYSLPFIYVHRDYYKTQFIHKTVGPEDLKT